MTTNYSLKPYISSTKYVSSDVSGKQKYWVFKITPRTVISKLKAATWFLKLYPEVKILKIKVVKTYKITKVVFVCDKPAPWAEV